MNELAIIAAVGVLVTLVLSRLKLPTVAGLLAAGAVLGPHTTGLVSSVHDIEMLSEVGVVLLLFTIGLEFSLTRLRSIFRQVAIGGVLQVGVTAGLTVGVALAVGEPVGRSVFYGFAMALSSTAIMLRMLSERQELDAPHGRFIVGTLIFQDLCVIPMVLIVPLLAPGESGSAIGWALVFALLKAALVVVVTVGLSRYVVPRVLGWVDASNSREVFLLAILALCIGTAWLTSLAGLSLALGAFLGGMVVADTEYGHRAMSDVLPLRDAFVSVFFVVLGMLLDPMVVWQQPALVGLWLLGFVGLKGAIATGAALFMKFPARAAWLAGVGLAQFGEFGFVLTRLAADAGLVSSTEVDPMLAAGIISMFLAPVFLRAAPHITAGERLLAPLERMLGVRTVADLDSTETHSRSGHVIIVGFGVAGTLAARAVRDAGGDLVVFDMSIENVQRGRELGLPVYYGDATSEEALRHAGVQKARLLVLLMNDPAAAVRIVDTSRRIAPDTPVLMRARYLSDRARLLEAGASDVMSEEVEGAAEVVSRLLRALEIPRNVIEEQLTALRESTQTTERRLRVPRSRLQEHRALDDMKIESVLIRDPSEAHGRSLRQLNLRTRTGALVVGIRRGEELRHDVDPDQALQVGDTVYLVGSESAVEAASAMLST